MHEELTHTLFEEHLNTAFVISLTGAAPDNTPPVATVNIALTLTEVKQLDNHTSRTREPFALTFQGPANHLLQQATYELSHAQMNTHPIFIVPVAQNEHGYQYEAIFN